MSSESNNSSGVGQKAKQSPPKKESCSFGPWTVTATKSHIMGSICSTPKHCKDVQRNGGGELDLCSLCRFSKQVGRSNLPDMIFDNNSLRVEHSSGAGVEFTALDALRQLRDADQNNIQVAHAREWKEARLDCEHTHNVVSGYDWTYTTDYCGTLLGDMTVQATEERIDMDKLKVQEPIRFYQELYLYEDELDDNGATICVVKIRCMDSGFLVLFRHYLRVDHVLVRIKDTRLYHATGTDYLLRERVERKTESGKFAFLRPDDPELAQDLSVSSEVLEKLLLPAASPQPAALPS